MAGSFSQILLHVIFSTKNRQSFIAPEIEPRLHAYLGGLVRERKGVPIEINGMSEHIHMLIRWRNDETVSNLMRDVKAISSGWVKQELGQGVFAWQEGFAAFSVSMSQSDAVVQYIRTQKEHHRHLSFMDEYVEFLRRHQIEFDPKYLW